MTQAGGLRRFRRHAVDAVGGLIDCTPIRGRVVFRMPARIRAVALTFDDGPDPDHTPRLLEILAEHSARATFFLVGERAERHPELVRRIAAEGHTLGNHTYSHKNCSKIDIREMIAELDHTDRVVHDAGVSASALPFRPPWGKLSLAQYCHLLSTGRPIVLWSCNPYDFRSEAPAIARHCSSAKPRDVILLHDRFPHTREALPEIITSLRHRRIEFVGLNTK